MKRILIAIIILFNVALVVEAQQVCVGTPGQITWQVYRGLYDDEVDDLDGRAPSLVPVA